MAGKFEGTFIQGFPALSFAYLIPFVEVAVGIMLMVGGHTTRRGLALGILLMGGIMSGTCIIEQWSLLPSQLLHSLAFYALLINPTTPEKKVRTRNK